MGFEPTVRGLGEQPISSRPRYDHFGTSPLPKESSQQVFAPFPEKAALNVNFVIERELVHVEEGAKGTSFLIETAKYEPLYTSLDYSASAHDAGFHGHVQGAAYQSEIVQDPGRLHEREDLRVGDWRVHMHGEVVRPGYGLTIWCDHERTNGYLFGVVSFTGLSEAKLHKELIVHTNNITVLQNKIKQIGDVNLVFLLACRI